MNKKRVSFLFFSAIVLTVILLTSFYTNAPAYAMSPVKIVIDGVELKEPVYELKNDILFLRATDLAKRFAGEAEWDRNTNQVTLIIHNKCVVFTKDNNYVYGPHGTIYMENAAPFIKNSKIYIPIRYLCQGMGWDIHWEEQNRQVTIDTDIYGSRTYGNYVIDGSSPAPCTETIKRNKISINNYNNLGPSSDNYNAKSRAEVALYTVGGLGFLRTALMLNHYLQGSGQTYFINFREMNSTCDYAMNEKNRMIQEAILAAEHLYNGRSIAATMITQDEHNFLQQFDLDVNTMQVTDWYNSVSGYRTYTKFTVKKIGNKYSMDVLYYFEDLYDFENASINAKVRKLLLISQAELCDLNTCGLARVYEVRGCDGFNVQWEKGKESSAVITDGLKVSSLLYAELLPIEEKVHSEIIEIPPTAAPTPTPTIVPAPSYVTINTPEKYATYSANVHLSWEKYGDGYSSVVYIYNINTTEQLVYEFAPKRTEFDITLSNGSYAMMVEIYKNGTCITKSETVLFYIDSPIPLPNPTVTPIPTATPKPTEIPTPTWYPTPIPTQIPTAVPTPPVPTGQHLNVIYQLPVNNQVQVSTSSYIPIQFDSPLTVGQNFNGIQIFDKFGNAISCDPEIFEYDNTQLHINPTNSFNLDEVVTVIIPENAIMGIGNGYGNERISFTFCTESASFFPLLYGGTSSSNTIRCDFGSDVYLIQYTDQIYITDNAGNMYRPPYYSSGKQLVFNISELPKGQYYTVHIGARSLISTNDIMNPDEFTMIIYVSY